MILIMTELNFLCEEKILARLGKRTIFALMCIVMKTSWLFKFTFQIKNWKLDGLFPCNWWQLIALCVHQNILTGLCFTKQNKNKKYVCKSCLQCFSSRNVLTEHKIVCLSINGAQSVRLEKGTIEFKSYFKNFMLILSAI